MYQKLAKIDIWTDENDLSTIKYFLETVSSIAPKSNEKYTEESSSNNIFNIDECTSGKIEQLIQKLSSNKATGYDGISNKILKIGKSLLSSPISTLINISISSGLFPSQLKIAKVTPVPKNNASYSHMSNLRPISVLPSISKIIEQFIAENLMDYLSKNDIIVELQFGFRRKRSTNDALASIQKFIFDNRNKRR
ncbi:RNA-directed DNA polymerase from mobile element jockey-like protein, partial [Dinothrombium tinctorium]